MDLKYIAVLTLAFVCSYNVQGSSLEVNNMTKYMGDPAYLNCKYTSSSIHSVVLIRWSKYSDNGTLIPVAMLMMTDGTKPTFMPSSTEHRMDDHAKLSSEKTGTSVSLRIEIDGLKCEDAGKYQCQVMDYQQSNPFEEDAYLNIEVHPKTPTFSTEELQVTVNTSFELQCEAEVGTPPQVIKFSYKAPGSIVYTQVKEGVTSELIPEPKRCTNMAKSTLELTMTEEMDNSHYLCSLAEARLDKDGTPKNFDEIILKVYRETTTTTTTKSPSTTPKKSEAIQDNSAVSVSGSCSALLYGLLALVVLRVMRTAS